MSNKKDENSKSEGFEFKSASIARIAQEYDKMTENMESYASEEDFFEKTASFGPTGAGNAGALGAYRAMQSPYPSAFLTLSDMQIPESATEIFQWCKYTYMFDPLIAGAINALSSYPVTEITLEDIKNKEDGKEDEESDVYKEYERVLFDTLDVYKLLVEIGIDYYLYGNCFAFGELWTNPSTGKPEWKRVIRLDPTKMKIDHNQATGTTFYRWEVPDRVKNIVKTQKPYEEYQKIPEMIKQAVRENKTVVLNSDNIYHFARPSDSSGNSTGWGTPIIANVLKLIMYRNVLRQAQEAIAREHIVPFRLFYLNPSTDSLATVNTNWKNVSQSLAGELMKAVKDPNYKVVSPYPVGMVEAGGNGRALMLTSEIEQVQNEILAGMNVPREFIFGGISYSGGSIALKILENNFATYRLYLKDFIQNFLIKGMAKARREWVNEKDDSNLVTVKFADLKMMDDAQKKQISINLNGAGKISNRRMWEDLGIDADKMKDELEKEQADAIESNFELQKQQFKMQLELQVYQYKLTEEYRKKYPEVFANQDPNMQMQNDPNMQQGDPNAQQNSPNMQMQNGPNMQQSDPNAQQNDPIAQQEASADEQFQAQFQKLAKDMKLTKNEQGLIVQLMDLGDRDRLSVLSKLPQKMAARIHEALKICDKLKEELLQQQQSAQTQAQVQNTQAQVQQAQQGQAQQQEQGGTPQTTDMRPMPEQRPPRRRSLGNG